MENISQNYKGLLRYLGNPEVVNENLLELRIELSDVAIY